jgi:hypothetical protein
MERSTRARSMMRIAGQSIGPVLAAAREPRPVQAGILASATPVVASDAHISSPAFVPADLTAPWEPDFWRQTGDVFALHVRPTERALRDVLLALSRGGVRAVLDESPRVLTDELGPDVGAALWWTSPQTWEKRAAVGVVIETP